MEEPSFPAVDLWKNIAKNTVKNTATHFLFAKTGDPVVPRQAFTPFRKVSQMPTYCI